MRELVSKEDRIFDIVNTIFLTVVLFVVVYPLYFVLIASISDPDYINRGEIILFPRGVSIGAYKTVLKDPRILTGYYNTIIYTFFGTLISTCVTIGAAFSLSRKELLGRKFFMGVFLFTMYFNGGLIPTYLVAKNLGLINTRAAIIVIGSLGIWNLIVCRTFFVNTIPGELWEASSIDGCSMWKFFFRIVLPNSKAIIAIMVLYYAVGQWNEYMRALIYLNKMNLYPLQLILRDILIANQSIMAEADPSSVDAIRKQAEVMKYAVIVISSLPVLMLYPFIQKYFVKGVMVGSLKG